MSDGRKNWVADLARHSFTGKRIWVHCASLGEFEQGRPLIERIKNMHPKYSIILTFFSSSGYEVRKDYEGADYICYLPFDGKSTSARFIELLKPDLAIFIKYEFWYHYLKELKSKEIPTFSISAIFRPDQQFFKKRGNFFQKMLSCFDYFFVQNKQSKELLNGQGYENVSVSGDTRFDRVVEICGKPKKIEIARVFKGEDNLMVIGSSWPEDIEVLLPIMNNPLNQLKFIIAPHETEPDKIRKLCKEISVKYQLFSQAEKETIHSNKVLIVDSIGLLSSLYQYGEIAYIGGAFGEGLHNILEAATFGMPIIFGKGKENHKYQEAIDLVNAGGAFEIANSTELESVLQNVMGNEEKLQEISRISKDYVISQTGATDSIMDYLSKYLN